MLGEEDQAILEEEINAQLQEMQETILRLHQAVRAVVPDNGLFRMPFSVYPVFSALNKPED
jgi:hypothetical protein